ncbi:MAG: reverse transcriptase domain-containing protein, partial [Candidatus Solibacter sp.]|nr:reverse transcriptase domain-containing protein [Candidatus Solibacter sp.]
LLPPGRHIILETTYRMKCALTHFMRENRTYSLSGGRWPARKRATSDPTPKKLGKTEWREGPLLSSSEPNRARLLDCPRKGRLHPGPVKPGAKRPRDSIMPANCNGRYTEWPSNNRKGGSLFSTTRFVGRTSCGKPGVDIDAIRDSGEDRFLGELEQELRNRRYRAAMVRRVHIPKPGQPGKTRPLGIPTVKDRVVQMAVKLVIEPLFEADFLPCSFGFRPKKKPRMALSAIVQSVNEGYSFVVDVDLKSYLDTASYCPLVHDTCSNSGGC